MKKSPPCEKLETKPVPSDLKVIFVTLRGVTYYIKLSLVSVLCILIVSPHSTSYKIWGVLLLITTIVHVL